MSDGTARCWGFNGYGELGDGTHVRRLIPTTVVLGTGEPLVGVTAVATGAWHSCALIADGTVRCWGENAYGELGNGTTRTRYHPVTVRLAGGVPLSGVVQITAGGMYTCALLQDTTVGCWGYGDRIGTGSTSDQAHPTAVVADDGSALVGVTQLAGGGGHSCALVNDGTVRCWGWNDQGQLGDGTHRRRSHAVPVVRADGERIRHVTAIAAGSSQTCALFESGVLQCWGANAAGQLGDGTLRSRPHPVTVTTRDGQPLQGVTGVDGGDTHTCALTQDTGVVCWGNNDYHQLGTGGTRTHRHPVSVIEYGGDPLHAVTQVTAGTYHSCATLSDGTARCWADNRFGQLGDGTRRSRRHPIEPTGL